MTGKTMRQVFGEELCLWGEQMDSLVVLDADVSSSTQTKLFGLRYPQRFFNFGIAEANMVSAAAGMAACGLVPVVSTFAFLLTLRAGDPVHSLIAYNKLNVKLAGGYAGLSDFADGASHQSVMDLAIMRALPNMTVLVPSDAETTRGAVKAMLRHEGPVYLRLSRDLAESLHQGEETFEIGKAKILKEGGDVTLVVSGTLLSQALRAAQLLEKKGIHASVLEYPVLKPFDRETLKTFAERTGRIITLEEHSIIGGLGGAVAECLGEAAPCPMVRLGVQDSFGESGAYNALLQRYGLTADHVADAAEALVRGR